jgi:hypothetical protein
VFHNVNVYCVCEQCAPSRFSKQNITFRKSNPFAFSREKAGASIQFGLLGYLITDNNETGFFNTPIWVPVFSTLHVRTESEHFPETFSCYQYNSVTPVNRPSNIERANCRRRLNNHWKVTKQISIPVFFFVFYPQGFISQTRDVTVKTRSWDQPQELLQN